jgi:hypothetical protein
VANASFASSLEEEADYLEFELAGRKVKGWVWRSPFSEGDRVNVVGDERGDHIELAGIARPSDRTIALYPHCSRSRLSHGANAVKWWSIGTSAFIGFTLLLIYFVTGQRNDFWDDIQDWFGLPALGVAAFTAIMTISLTRKWMPFVRVAEKVFRALDLPHPSRIDLVKSSKARRKPGDPGEYGTFWFRY